MDSRKSLIMSDINKQEIETVTGGQVAQNVQGNQVQANTYIENLSIYNNKKINLKLIELNKPYPYFSNYNIIRRFYNNYIVRKDNKIILYINGGWQLDGEKIYIVSRDASLEEKELCEIKKEKKALSGWETPYDCDYIKLFHDVDLDKILEDIKIYLFEIDNNIIDYEKEIWNSLNKDLENGKIPF
eukprot:GHVO01008978.1.p1 GENE.GHVO01008978.1~~GHVO01008978.1.p1  ORF type:complete len:186 (-),score=3.50 GHVO01008978.1:316-873(-)